MKNYLLSRWWTIMSATNHQLFLVMRTTAILLLLGTMHLSATTMSQTITLNVRKAGLKQVFTTIEKQTGYAVLYSDEAIAGIAPIDVNASRMPLETFLTSVLSPVYLSYRIDGTSIFIKPDGKPLKAIKPELALPTTVQQRSVSGKVTDEMQQPLDGVTVTVKGTTVVTTTDATGSYQVQLPDGGSVLVFSNIGYRLSEISIGNRQRVDVTLAVAVSDLDEVVVVGYGTMRRRDLTGAVGSVNSEQIKDLAVARVEQALSGRVAGVQIKSVTGEPGAAPQIRVRGIGSISAGVNPLYVVDGFPTDNIQTLNPNDIESIDILKDASASAIYGSRGANGVIIINTKRGQVGKTTLGFDTYHGIQRVSKLPKMKNALEQAQYTYDGFRNRNVDEGYDVSGHGSTWRYPAPPTVLDVLEGRNTHDADALEAILRTAPQSQYQLSASGGSENIKYALSGELLSQDGIIINSDFKRYSLRANIDAKLTDRLSVNLNLNPSMTRKRALPQYSGGQNLIGAAMAVHNFFPLLDDHGDYVFLGGNAALAERENPLALARETITNNEAMRFLGNINAKYRITDELSLNVLLGGNVHNSKGMTFKPRLPVFFNVPATGTDNAAMVTNWLGEYTLNYDKGFGKHTVAGLVGYTAQKERGESNELSSNQFPNNLVPTLNATGGIITNGASSTYEWSLVSYLARFNYNYDNKYYLTTSVRADGSSRFGADNKYGFFPSVALAWRVSEEPFLRDVDFLSDLRLRASYGETGNNNIGNYDHLATINYENYVLGGQVVGGFGQSRIANTLLSWEKQRQVNMAVDISLLNERINVTVDHFRSRNTDLLLQVNVPDITGFSTALQNIGEVENVGWEFILRTTNLANRFKWSTDFNVSTYRNKVLKLGPEGAPIYSGINITTIGQPIGMFFGWLSDGVFMNEQELANGPIFNPGAADRSRPGDFRFVDISGPDGVPDGIIDSYDNTIMGNPYPDFLYGMTNSFSYKNISLSVTLQGTHGNDVYNLSRNEGNSGRGRVRSYAFNNDYWKSESEPGDGKTQRPNDAPTGGGRIASQQFLDNGSFLRINNITLGYLVPSRWSEKIRMSALRFYVNATNPLTFTNYVSFNPDVSLSNNPLQPGREQNEYPLPKSFMFGLNASF